MKIKIELELDDEKLGGRDLEQVRAHLREGLVLGLAALVSDHPHGEEYEYLAAALKREGC